MAASLSFGSNVLAPTTSSSLNSRPEQALCKKRKWDDGGSSKSNIDSFEAITLPESHSNPCRTFVYITVLLRSKLPLAWLESGLSTDHVHARLLFRASIPKPVQAQATREDSVRIVRLTSNERLYAVENVQGDTHVACLLAAWATEDYILANRGSPTEVDLLEKLLGAQHAPATIAAPSGPGNQHGTAAPTMGRSPKKPKNRRGVLARMSILPAKDSIDIPETPASLSTELLQLSGNPDESQTVDPHYQEDYKTFTSSAPVLDCETVTDLVPQACAAPHPLDAPDVTNPDPHIILEALHGHYLETLYTSKMSLAYFAKGPMTRARIQFQSISPFQMSSLADFYRASIIPTKKMDLKYRESMIEVLQNTTGLNTPIKVAELAALPAKTQNRQKTKKQRKIGKNGLYPTETGFITAWWGQRAPRGANPLAADSQSNWMRSLVADLRSRETEMQILLTLEALALESADQAGSVDTPTTNLIKDEPLDQEQSLALTGGSQIKTAKKRDLGSELEALVDRLCIWHAVGLEDMMHSPAENEALGNGLKSQAKDKLRDFCADVIVPFYSARLPGHCKSICQKLGGPELSPNQPKPKATRSLSSARIPPGAAIRAPRSSISKRTLQRVLSEDQGSRHASPPVLSRSCTAPSVPNLKRDPTESLQRPESRGGLQKSRSFANREIDLVTDAKTQDVKQKKLANLAKQKQEIDAAINALRKPNRSSAAKEIVDEIEKRKMDATTGSRRLGLAVHVTATPRKAKRNITTANGHLSPTLSATKTTVEAPGIASFVPSSTVRPSITDIGGRGMRSSASRGAVISAIDETPSREAPKTSNPLGLAIDGQNPISRPGVIEMDHVDISGVKAASLVQATPSANRLRPDMFTGVEHTPMRMKGSQRPVLFTPLKKTEISVDYIFKDAPEIPEKAGQAMDRVMGGGSAMSIYDSLGWNDFDDIG